MFGACGLGAELKGALVAGMGEPVGDGTAAVAGHCWPEMLAPQVLQGRCR